MLEHRRALPRVETFLGDGIRTEMLLDYMEGLFTRNAGVMYACGTVDGSYLLVNHGFEQLVGKPAREIVGRTPADLFPAAFAAAHHDNDEQVRQEGRARTFAETACDTGGTVRHYVSHKFPLMGTDGAVFAVGGLSVDITHLEYERRADRVARLDAESRFHAVFDHAPIGQVFSDTDGVVTVVNAALASMLGYRPEQMIGRPALDFLPPAEQDAARDEAQTLLGGSVPSIGTVRHFRHRDGHDVLVRVVSSLLPDRSGGPQWWASMVVDLSEEERTRAALEQAHADALASAERLHLLHSIATAANEARSLDDLAPQVLRSVCARFGWPQGALLHWNVAAATAPRCRHIVGDGDLADEVASLDPPSNDEPELLVRAGKPAVIVPLTSKDPDRFAMVFGAGPTTWAQRQREVLGLVGSECSRVLERESADLRQRETELRFRTVFDASPLAMGLTVGETGTYSEVNEALCQLVGRTRDQLIGASAREIIHPDDAHLADPAGAAAAAAPDGRHRVEMRLVHSSGAVVIAEISLAWMDGPAGTRLLLAQMQDITARRSAETALRDQAEHDSLTGLANRSHLARVLAELGKDAGEHAVLFIDLDGFKLINDTRGHDVGDEVLIEVAARLRSAVRPSDLVARFGGDEFVVVLGASAHNAAADTAYGEPTTSRVADRIDALLSVPIETSSGSARVTASIGISSSAVVPGVAADLLQRADSAMYRAKRLGKDRRATYDLDLHEETVDYQRTAASLRNALAEDRFLVHYQPIVRLSDAHIVGFEALVRLRDEAGEIVPPGRFISVAEQSRLIVPLGAWVLARSCETIARLRRKTGREIAVSVNVAAQQALRTDLTATVRDALIRTGLPASALILELTESALLEADAATLNQLEQLREQGVSIALDDFGTGYSSLAYLRRLPVSSLKVDQSFVRGITSDGGDAAIVRAVTGLAEQLHLAWVAEGVETAEQRRALSALGTGLAQGYLFSRPVPADQLGELLRSDCATAGAYRVPRPV